MEYDIFKQRIRAFQSGEEDYEGLYQMYKIQTPTEKDKLQLLIPMKLFNRILKQEPLYREISPFLHLLLRYTVKAHSKGVAESMGNHVEMHADKRRRLDVEAVGREAFISIEMGSL